MPTLTGLLEHKSALGGETKGWWIEDDELDPVPNGLKLEPWLLKEITVAGEWESRSGIERDSYRVLVLTSVKSAA